MFEPQTREKAGTKPRVLICDGHDSHLTGDFIEHCMSHNIKLLILPPHSSHFTQPLDIGMFSPLKEYLTQEINQYVTTKVATVQKVEWLQSYIYARARAFTESNIKGSWNGAGLEPFSPRKVFSRIESESSTPPSTPTQPNNPFDKALLTSPPFDIEKVQAANAAMISVLLNKEPITTPAHQYIF
jgi:hypothetical protein